LENENRFVFGQTEENKRISGRIAGVLAKI
jgi:hypothetical protein